MIYITGDIHANPYIRLRSESFPEGKELTKDDVVIILGDFGIIWDKDGESPDEKYKLDWLNKKPWTTVFIEGNHDNHIRLKDYPIKEWHGGKVHEIRSSVLHLMRGEIFTIQDKKFFAFGGASSHDIKDGILNPNDKHDAELIKKWQFDYSKLFRILNVSWWKEELPSVEECNNGIMNLSKHNNKVDFVLTHSPSTSMLYLLNSRGLYEPDILTNYLEDIRINIDYKKWFFGHMHIDKAINDKNIGLYEQIVRIA